MKNILVIAGAVLTMSTTAMAQDAATISPPPGGGVTVTLGGGATFPVGDAADGLKTGFNLLGGLGFNIPSFPIAMRAEVGYNQMNAEVGNGKFRILSGGVNGIVQVPMAMAGLAPYVTAGVGIANVKATGNDAQNKFTYNAGLGVKWSMTRFDAFVESRFTSILTENQATNFVPLFVGVTFRP